MHIAFYSTCDVFRAEEILSKAGIKCKVVPTPVQNKAVCGVCLEFDDPTSQNYLAGIEFVVLD